MICLGMIVIFFVTSADSGAMVLNMLSARGRDDTPALQRSIWTLVIAITASVLLLGGGLQALQGGDYCECIALCDCIARRFLGFRQVD
jgi:choline/glycine/proline betaine transport protein